MRHSILIFNFNVRTRWTTPIIIVGIQILNIMITGIIRIVDGNIVTGKDIIVGGNTRLSIFTNLSNAKFIINNRIVINDNTFITI